MAKMEGVFLLPAVLGFFPEAAAAAVVAAVAEAAVTEKEEVTCAADDDDTAVIVAAKGGIFAMLSSRLEGLSSSGDFRGRLSEDRGVAWLSAVMLWW